MADVALPNAQMLLRTSKLLETLAAQPLARGFHRRLDALEKGAKPIPPNAKLGPLMRTPSPRGLSAAWVTGSQHCFYCARACFRLRKALFAATF